VKHRLIFLKDEDIFSSSQQLIFEVTHRSKTGNTHESGCFTNLERTDYRWSGVCRNKWLKEDITLIKEEPDFVSYPSKGAGPSDEDIKPHYHGELLQRVSESCRDTYTNTLNRK
jgi:hypothetical protein